MTADDVAFNGAETGSSRLHALALRPLERMLLGGLELIAKGSLLAILVALLFAVDVPLNPLRLIRLVTGFCLLPSVAIVLLRWVYVAQLQIDSAALTIRQRHRSLEIALHDIVAIDPWALPSPGSGLWLRLRSGSRLPVGLQLDDPAALIEALAEERADAAMLDCRKRASVVFAGAKQRSGAATARGLMLKFPVFAVVPTLPLFRVHQLIAYGGVFGEYRQYGLKAYLAGFAIYWATLTIYLMLYAAALRVPVEVASWAAAVFAPRHAVRVRRMAERFAAVLFFVGVPLFVLLRFIPW